MKQLIVIYLIVVGKLVDRYLVLARVALLSSREEGLREVEPGQPEHVRWTVGVPVLTIPNFISLTASLV